MSSPFFFNPFSGAPMKLSTTLFGLSLLASLSAQAEVTRYPLPNNSTFPIASAVEVTAGSSLVFQSGTTPAPANPEAKRGTPEYYGDTMTQAKSVFERMGANLKTQGLDFGDIIKMTVFLVGDPENDGMMDFAGFMKAYTQYFGTAEQPNLPARSAVQVAGLVAPLMFVEIEVIAVRPPKAK
jgi:enamine deaminase RidA (YjgF/YER057c/UK114 family)